MFSLPRELGTGRARFLRGWKVITVVDNALKRSSVPGSRTLLDEAKPFSMVWAPVRKYRAHN